MIRSVGKDSLCCTAIVSMVFLISCGSPQDEAQSVSDRNIQSTCNVVFYNVENLFHPENDPDTNDDWFTPESEINWDQKKYEHKLEQLAKAISWTGNNLPVLVGLAEVENEQCVSDLAQSKILQSGAYDYVHYDSPDERGIDVALLFRPDLFKLRKSAPIMVELPGDHTRDILHVIGDLDGERIHVFVCHWSSRGEGVEETEPRRIKAAQTLRKEVDRILKQSPTASVLIMGDLNDYPTDRSVQQTLGATCNDEPGGVMVDLVCSEHKTGRGSYNFRGDWGFLDHFIVSSGMLDEDGIVAAEAKALWNRKLLFDHPKFGRSPDRTYGGRRYHGGYSDHLPIVLELQLRVLQGTSLNP
jgi:predicted extracellular nuclease